MPRRQYAINLNQMTLFALRAPPLCAARIYAAFFLLYLVQFPVPFAFAFAGSWFWFTTVAVAVTVALVFFVHVCHFASVPKQ